MVNVGLLMDLFIQVIGLMIKKVDKENLSSQIQINMKVSSRMIKDMEKEPLLHPIMKSTQEIGKMIKETDLALAIMQMKQFMKVIG